MPLSLARFKTFIFSTAALLLFATNCANVARLVESADPYHTEAIKLVITSVLGTAEMSWKLE